MNDTELSQIVSQTAVWLSKSDGKAWHAVPGQAKRGFGKDIRTDDGEIVNFQDSTKSPYPRERLWIEVIDPLTASSVAKPISVAAARGGEAIAREIANRLLPDGRAELAERREQEAKRLAAFNARAALVNAVETMFGEPTDFGTLDPDARGEVNYKTEARLPLRGKSLKEVWRGHAIYEHEFARVEVTGDGSLMNVSLKDIPAGVVMRMLRVLADYNAMWPAPAACCERYGTPHPAEYCEPGCPQNGTEGTPEPKPFSAEFERLYGEYLAAGARGSWTDWLKSRAV